jgi:hypothetical protein
MKRTLIAAAILSTWNAFAGPELVVRVETSVRHALDAMASKQVNGGWGMAWTQDGRHMWGEYRMIPDGWITVQPPATPSVASVFLQAARVLDDPAYAQRARMARDALLAIQTADGGFPYEADPKGQRPMRATFDDDTTTGALRFLIDLWQFTKDEADLRTVRGVGDFLLKAQYPDTGGWPQEYPPMAMTYGRHITFNDNATVNVIRALLSLHTLSSDRRYLEAAIKGGDCIIRLQGGPGEEIWAAQYDPVTLRPAWARKFEPPSYSSAESIGVCNILIDLYLATGLECFLEPLPKAFAWYDIHRLPNGQWARFYEVGTQRPVYGRKDKAEPVYDMAQAKGGYSWQGAWYPEHAKRAYERIKALGRDVYAQERRAAEAPPKAASLEPEVEKVCASLTPAGWWLAPPDDDQRTEMKEKGIGEDEPIITAEAFCKNAGLLLTYLERVRADK